MFESILTVIFSCGIIVGLSVGIIFLGNRALGL